MATDRPQQQQQLFSAEKPLTFTGSILLLWTVYCFSCNENGKRKRKKRIRIIIIAIIIIKSLIVWLDYFRLLSHNFDLCQSQSQYIIIKIVIMINSWMFFFLLLLLHQLSKQHRYLNKIIIINDVLIVYYIYDAFADRRFAQKLALTPIHTLFLSISSEEKMPKMRER